MNPLPFRPTTALERRLCELVEQDCGEVVLNVWTPENYPLTDIDEQPVRVQADYEVRTGRLHNGLFVAGTVYRAFVSEGDVRIEFEACWR
ncbi:hypothetical protein [Roseateles noduli]|uniref:hypothetical protein n=1 Tax=Roseateles noduli TaxID=2052484 RepID=UPI003D6592B5